MQLSVSKTIACILELPKVIGNSLVKAGSNADFKCEYTGPQTIAWYKNGKEIQNNRGGKVKNTNQRKQSLGLHLSNITSSDTYSCGATFDKNQTAFTDIKLEIFGELVFTFLPQQ